MASERAKEWRERAGEALLRVMRAEFDYGRDVQSRVSRSDAERDEFVNAWTELKAILNEPLSWSTVNMMPATWSEPPTLEWDY